MHVGGGSIDVKSAVELRVAKVDYEIGETNDGRSRGLRESRSVMLDDALNLRTVVALRRPVDDASAGDREMY